MSLHFRSYGCSVEPGFDDKSGWSGRLPRRSIITRRPGELSIPNPTESSDFFSGQSCLNDYVCAAARNDLLS